MANFRQELDELVNAVTAEVAPGGSIADKGHRIAREAFDVIGKIVDIDDDDATRDEATAEIEAAAGLIVDRLLADNRLLRRAAKAALPFAMPGVVDSIAAYAGTAEEWIADNVAPALARWEETIHRARVALG